jgi:hypothetical protein
MQPQRTPQQPGPHPRRASPTIAVVFTRREAYAASCALVRAVYEHAGSLEGELEGGMVGGLHTVDAQSTTRRLAPLLDALEQLGWPHAHEWPGCEFTLSEGEEDVSPWGGLSMRAQERIDREAGNS